MRRLLPALAGLAVLAACGESRPADIEPVQPATESGSAHHFDVRKLAGGFERPTWVGVAPGDGDALWVLEQPGKVLRVRGERRETVLDLGDQLKLGAEQGLLGIAFAPGFARSGRFDVHWSDPAGDTRVAEFELTSRRPARATPVRELLFVDQPEENHNGGQLAFGRDGLLYLGLGDGGGAFDPNDNAQNLDSKLGKILAADVSREKPRWEVVAYGLRNPWRFAFHPALDELWVGDVGQDEREEIDRIPIERDEPPKNLGWPAFEASTRIQDRDLDETGALVWPIAAYEHEDGCSVTGGVIYAGTKLDRMMGRYVYGDFCSGILWTLEPAPEGGARDVRRERARVGQLSHIGTDSDGELLFASQSGSLYEAVRVP